jgi:hypothetical protein
MLWGGGGEHEHFVLNLLYKLITGPSKQGEKYVVGDTAQHVLILCVRVCVQSNQSTNISHWLPLCKIVAEWFLSLSCLHPFICTVPFAHLYSRRHTSSSFVLYIL